MFASCSAGPSAWLAMTEFFCVAAEPRKPLMMKILVCQEAFILGMLTGVFFQPHGSHTTLFVCLPVLHRCHCRVAVPQGEGVWERGRVSENVKGAFLRLKPAAFDYGLSLRQ